MIRVAHLIQVMEVGGLEQMVLELCRFRDRAQFECTAAAPQEGVIVDEIRATGTPVYTGPNAFREAARGADIVNLHWWHYSYRLLSQVQATGLPYVTTLHWHRVLPPLPSPTICCSQYTFRSQVHPERCVLIPNGVDLSRFAPPCGPTREEVILTRVCRPSKCALYFWDAMKEVLARYPETQLRIVGNPEDCCSGSDRIRVLGLRRDIPGILADTDVFVYTPYPETGCNDLVVMEASAMGVPCVVSNVNCVRESVIEGRNGFLTPYGDVDAVVERVGMLVRDVQLRAKLSGEAVKLARERFDIVDVARRYEIVYRAVLDHDRNRPWYLHEENQSQSQPQF
jgi:glycosyltransferase involved in cell wall biosynthesis